MIQQWIPFIHAMSSALPSGTYSFTWLIDSGASNHMTGNVFLLTKSTAFSSSSSILTPDGTALSLSSVGNTFSSCSSPVDWSLSCSTACYELLISWTTFWSWLYYHFFSHWVSCAGSAHREDDWSGLILESSNSYTYHYFNRTTLDSPPWVPSCPERRRRIR